MLILEGQKMRRGMANESQDSRKRPLDGDVECGVIKRSNQGFGTFKNDVIVFIDECHCYVHALKIDNKLCKISRHFLPVLIWLCTTTTVIVIVSVTVTQTQSLTLIGPDLIQLN